MDNTIKIGIEEGEDIDLTRVRLDNGVSFTIIQHSSGHTSINIHGMTEKTNVAIMGRKVTKKLSQLGNTSLKMVE